LLLPCLKIGSLVPGCIVKALPDHESYLILISNTENLAFLPRKYANRPYKVGHNIIASVFILDSRKIILSQKSPQYFLRVAELIFEPLISEGKITVVRAASIINGGFVKIAVESKNGIDPVTACLPYLKEAKLYTDATITLIKYSPNMTEYIKNSFAPAPAGKIKKVIYSHNNREATVRVHEHYYGQFVGRGGANVATAAKLLDISIKIFKTTEETPLNAEN